MASVLRGDMRHCWRDIVFSVVLVAALFIVSTLCKALPLRGGPSW